MQENRENFPNWDVSVQSAKKIFNHIKNCDWDDFIEDDDLEEVRNSDINDEITVVKTQGGDNISNLALYFALLCLKLSVRLGFFYRKNKRLPTKEEYMALIPKCTSEYVKLFVFNLDFVCAIIQDTY